MNSLIPNEIGVWIECCNPNCKKWRYTLDFDDPLVVPKKWYCYMNSDQSMNSCSVPECLKLAEDEIFVESKYKAGCIVWAKVIGRPWNTAMIDFCPEYECYYWFDNDNTNTPSQYHVTFLSGKKVTRAWIKTRFIKSFVENKNPAFALKAKVCGKSLTSHQRRNITEGCNLARAALRLSLSHRLKKYNFNSWRLAQRLQNRSTGDSSKTLPLASAIQSNKENSKNVPAAEPSRIEKLEAVKNMRTTKNPAEINQPSKSSHQFPKEPMPSSTTRVTRARAKESMQQNANEDKPPTVKQLVIQDSESSVETEYTNAERMQNRREDSDDTRSISSFSSKDHSEALGTKRDLIAASKKQFIVTNQRSSSEETNKSGIDDDFDEIVPCSQESTPISLGSFTKIVPECDKADNVSNENQPVENTSVEIPIQKFGAIALSVKRVHCKGFLLKSIDEKKSSGFDITSPKSMSESSITNRNKENHSNNLLYRNALSEFKSRERDPLATLTNHRRTTTPTRRPLPSWFTNLDERRKIEAQQLDRLSKLSEDEDKKMYQENRESFIAEMESATADPSREKNRSNSKSQNHMLGSHNYSFDYLLSSDEDSI